ncbi:glycoside hydrolase family 31 protein [Listeria costaricensis]|uniref:glycoside hydrolase family 31 protein n=1 Tax=Listeria costaricensis TaxID=2026604 RepID=UPI001F096482|nr:glycoside hydrolase family 31 protein [Listeria costaricensis]
MELVRLMKGYLAFLQDDQKSVEQVLQAEEPQLESDHLLESATWLWLSARSGKEWAPKMEQTAVYICENWQREQSSPWHTQEKDIYLSVIAACYAALLEVKNSYRATKWQKTITEIRDFVFDNLLKGDTVLAGLKTRKVATDELFAVLPFGLFSPEDLVMVAAVKKMELQLATEEGVLAYSGAAQSSKLATAQMALYFLEKSEEEKAIFYLNQAKQMTTDEPLGDVFIALNEFYLAESATKEAHIKHLPFGNSNRYEKQLTERNPHAPETELHFSAACEVIAEQKAVNVQLLLVEKDWLITCESKHKQNVEIWEALVPPLVEPGIYHYYFEAELADGSLLRSDSFEVEPIQKHWSEKISIAEQEDGFICYVEEGEAVLPIRFSVAEDDEVKVTFDPTAPRLSGNETCGKFQKGDLTIEAQNNPVRLTISFKGDVLLVSHAIYPAFQWYTDASGAVQKVRCHLDSPKQQEFYGFGERYNALSQRGQVLDCFVYNQYRDQGTRTYIPMPFYHTNSGYSVFVDTARYTSFDLGNQLADKHTITIELNNEAADLYLFMGDVPHALQKYLQHTGQPEMLPVWALGPWMSSNNWDREKIVRAEVERTQKLQIPSTVVVLEQWSDEATYYMWNDAEYALKDPAEAYRYDEITFPEWGRWPDPQGMTDFIHENEMKLILWQIPIQKYLNRQFHPLKDQEEAYMIEQGYVVKHADGSPYRIPENWFTESLLMDFSNEAGKKWWFDKRQYLIDMGIDGFKTDGGEFVFGEEVTFADGRKGDEMRNLYPNEYIRAYYEFAQQNGGITFSRAGYTGAQTIPAHWAGDERSTFDAFKRSLIAGLSAGLSGLPFWGWDFGGFNGDIPTAELFLRSAAMAAFCPIMQYHAESKAEFNQDRSPWNIADRTGDESVIPIYRFFANVRMNLLPYIYDEAAKAVQTGLPMMRALVLAYPDDSRVSDMYDQYLFGDHLLVAPVIEEGMRMREVYLPEGDWYDFWKGSKYHGPMLHKCPCDRDEIPVFAKAGSAILLNLNETKELGSWVTNSTTAYQKPIVRIYLGTDFKQKITDHLGNTWKIQVTDHRIQVESPLSDYEVEVIGATKDVQIVKGV